MSSASPASSRRCCSSAPPLTAPGCARRPTNRGFPSGRLPKPIRKEDVAQPFYRRLKGGQGIACVLTSMEQGRTFVSYTPRFKPPSGDPNYRLIKACRKHFLHYYWYVL